MVKRRALYPCRAIAYTLRGGNGRPKTSTEHRIQAMTTEDGKDTRLLREITPRNLLSFAEPEPLELRNLNVLIGPNGSGKSNLIEVINLLRHIPTDIRPVMSKGGGAAEWIWKGAGDTPSALSITIGHDEPLCHYLQFRVVQNQLSLEDESISRLIPGTFLDRDVAVYRKGRRPDGPMAFGGFIPQPGKVFDSDKLDASLSILSQIRDPENAPEVTNVAKNYSNIGMYREWTFGRGAVFRVPQPADGRLDRLESDFSNLGMYLSKFSRKPIVKRDIVGRLRDLYEGLTEYEVVVDGGTVQLRFTEGDYSIPASRLSDGSLRYLCLLTLLCDPEPPPLICIEEPELGLHPDLLPKLADLLVEASTRTQVVVTTHSEILIDAFTERPEDVVVFEKHDGATQMKRLDQNELSSWLERYRLGELWSRGDIGGNRW